MDQLIEKVQNLQLLTEFEIFQICKKASDIFVTEPNVKILSTPITLVGDVHGQFLDFQEMLKVSKGIDSGNWLFLGDIVDRGPRSIECISLLFLYKIKWPERISIIRGNHETEECSMTHGFYAECQRKYGQNSSVWKVFNNAFNFLPFSALIDGKIFCAHGGISPQFIAMDQLRVLDRFKCSNAGSIISHLMWSDPDTSLDGWKHSNRGEGFMFGEGVLKEFLHYNNLECVCRAHQLCMDGFMNFWNGKLYTVWSAPNYVGRNKNKASILEIDGRGEKKFVMFEESKVVEREDTVVHDYFM